MFGETSFWDDCSKLKCKTPQLYHQFTSIHNHSRISFQAKLRIYCQLTVTDWSHGQTLRWKRNIQRAPGQSASRRQRWGGRVDSTQKWRWKWGKWRWSHGFRGTTEVHNWSSQPFLHCSKLRESLRVVSTHDTWELKEVSLSPRSKGHRFWAPGGISIATEWPGGTGTS